LGGYTLIIAEKPDAARRIAEALDRNGRPKKVEEGGVPYFIAHRDRRLVIVPALGHLYTVVQEAGGRDYYPVFNFRWAPRYLAERNAKKIRTWINVISKLAKNADEFINSCDYDLEGSLIGYCILKYACGGKEGEAKRMRFSTLTKRELERAYEKRLPTLDFALVEAGRTRHEIDWLYGVNLSRALTLAALRWSGKYATISTGRVQGPSLNFLVEREREIRCFVPTPYWSVYAEVELGGSTYRAEYERKAIKRRSEADAVVRACTGKVGKIERIDMRVTRQAPPTPFDLGTLQTEAYSLFKYSPRRTADIAERLYLEALISYPRTSSQKLPEDINYREILSSLGRIPAYKELASSLLGMERLRPREGRKEDPAHPAIYPTGKPPERPLTEPERRIWDLVVRRFMATFGEPSVKRSVRATIVVEGHRFHLRGRQVLREGWMRFYKPYLRVGEVILPPMQEGEHVRLKRVIREDKFTKPPPRYNPSSLLRKMEEEGIGTKATRADIIEILYDRRYIMNERIVVTDLGFDVIETLRRHCPSVISVELTRDLERRMEEIRQNSVDRVSVLLEAVERLKRILENFRREEGEIGRELSEAIRRARMRERIVGDCPQCDGKLIILHSRRTGKRFIGCTNYFKGKCKVSFPLPQRGTVKPTGKTCKACGWPLLEVKERGRRPWMLCFNPSCPSRRGGRK